MKKNFIHIFGASGSGTTTLGKYISEQLDYFFMDTDDYLWIETDPKYSIKREPEQRVKLMLEDINKNNNIVLSGSMSEWGDPLIPYLTLAVRLVTDTDLRIERLEKREHQSFGKRIEEGGDMYIQHLDFIKWAKEYDKGGMKMRSKTSHDAWQKLLTCPLLILDGSKPLEESFKIINDKLKEMR